MWGQQLSLFQRLSVRRAAPPSPKGMLSEWISLRGTVGTGSLLTLQEGRQQVTDEVNGGITVRPDAGALIAVDRSSKQRLRAAESGGVSQWVKGRSSTQATLVDSALGARLCNFGC
ncbi:unnamed protein product [Pleuronectes platessa]|uniref:Uncharacterized protein n=1 Tax=Pleuronectes platessa TaxID=8262 RepID=A0A9N7YN98_PLEPL|nr:unnamed protein product [Pleuronectes platessa]